MKASDLFVRCLEVEGVRTIFGLPVDYSENFRFMERRGQFICSL